MAAILEIINQIDRYVISKFCNVIVLRIIIYEMLHYLKLQIKTAKDATCTMTDLDFTNS